MLCRANFTPLENSVLKDYQAFNKDKLLAEQPEYFLFNGRVNSLSGERALKAKVGEKIRLFVGVGSHIASNFHIIGAIFDNLYPEGAITESAFKKRANHCYCSRFGGDDRIYRSGTG